MARLWFVTGAGRGLGRAFVEAALAHGDTVVATVRRDDALDDVAARFPTLHRRRLDVADHAAVRSVVDEVAPGEWAEPPPSVAAEALLALLDQPDPPLRTVIGNGAHDMVRLALEARRDDYLKDPAFTWPGPPATPARH
ncbi:SDR family NAD(P)-dependent oxidoreductase [Polymorphospora rubra]|uniref:Short-chain dehydrogenase/reductase SDR n=1 Tax=Polymorphospora rubra TaxID=338584 RepID=A0A810N9L1_9ACTN|nr:SDR family NAD(P)-dependent oxidoreductase [Polymorphospora rubra]BCJ69104.1 hypothetical protein Prubr_61250 [Polymorphospora rubra]